jgi:nucleoside-diphosphate-sugar epimerase
MPDTSRVPVLVIGGTGMIGACLVHRLVAEGYAVSVFARPTSSLLRLQPVQQQIEIIRGDLTDKDGLRACVEKGAPQTVFHLASTPFNPPSIPVEIHLQVNVVGMVNLLEALRRCPETKLVFTGSANVYGEGSGSREDQALLPGNILGATKACATIWLQTYARLYKLAGVELRLYTPYGPWERPGRLISHTILSALKKQDIRMTSGNQERDYLFIDDVVDALMLAMTKPTPPGTVYNICSGQGVPIRDIVQRTLRLMGNPVKVELGALPTRPDEIWKFSGDNTAAHRALGWQPRIGLEEGLRRTIDWFVKNRDLAEQLT